MKLHRRFTAAILACSIALCSAFVSGCNKENSPIKTKEMEIVSEDSIWYSTEKFDIASAYYADGRDYRSVMFNYLGKVADNYCCVVQSEEKIPADFNWETDDYYDYCYNDLLVVSSDGTNVNRISLDDAFDYGPEILEDLYVADDRVKLMIVSYGDGDSSNSLYEITINPITGEIGDRVSVSATNDSISDNDYKETVIVGDYRISTYYAFDEETAIFSYRMEVSDGSGSIRGIDFLELFPEQNINNLYIFEYGDNSAMIIASDGRSSYRFFKLNFQDMTLSDTSPDGTDWIGNINLANITSINGHAYYQSYGYISEIDFDNHTVTTAFDFNDSNVNRFDIKDCELVEFDDSNVVFTCKTWGEGMFTDTPNGFFLYKLTKNDVNPNAGKGIIEVGCISEITRPFADAICEFNDTSSTCFIRFDNTYNVDANVTYEHDMSYDEWQESYRNVQTELSYQLSIDLMAGEGPDIIVDGFSYNQLNNEDYLLDLTDYMAELDESSYFVNVLNGGRRNDSVYQIPISFVLQGIFTSADNVSDGQTGFTFDEYAAFVDEVCNGANPMHFSRENFFLECISAMSDSFVTGDGANFDNDVFRELAAYTKENIPKHVIGDFDTSFAPAVYTTIGGFDNYLSEYSYRNDGNYNFYGDCALLGIPSSDGRGPSAVVKNSVGISSQAANPDACWEFVKILLGDSIQESVSLNWAFPVKKSAYITTSTEIVTRYNNIVMENEGNPNPPFGTPVVRIDEGIIERLIVTIENSHVFMLEPAVAIILSEEIQPYFADQKTIDEVIEILQDRVDTVFNEG